MKKLFLIFFGAQIIFSQSYSLDQDFIKNYFRNQKISGLLESNNNFLIRKLTVNDREAEKLDLRKRIFSNEKNSVTLNVLPVYYNIEFNSKIPYKTNNGTMIPNRGYQHLISLGIEGNLGPLYYRFNPEHHFAQNLNFDGFPDSHYDYIWAKRYKLWNRIDLPERHGENRHNNFFLGQSYLKFKINKFSVGISNENIWWGPSIRNSIMMSNNSRGFRHITVNSNKPIETFIGNFEFQLISGRLESSGFTPPNPEYEFAGSKLYVPKINQIGEKNDWRYLQAIILTYNPKFLPDIHLGYIRWAQMYSALVEGKYAYFMPGKPTYFPVFQNLFRKADSYIDLERQTDQSAGFFFLWTDSTMNSEIYSEFYYNDSKQNLRDLLLDTDHALAYTIGFRKFFKKNNFILSWEWTKMEQSASRTLRNAGSWYEHAFVYDGYTNRGEVLGSRIGPGSNSHYFSFNKIVKNFTQYEVAFEIIENDNDFYYEAFTSAEDYRRYWKDISLHLNFSNKFKKLWLSTQLVYTRLLNYKWELQESATSYYVPGVDKNNIHLNLKLFYSFN